MSEREAGYRVHPKVRRLPSGGIFWNGRCPSEKARAKVSWSGKFTGQDLGLGQPGGRGESNSRAEAQATTSHIFYWSLLPTALTTSNRGLHRAVPMGVSGENMGDTGRRESPRLPSRSPYPSFSLFQPVGPGTPGTGQAAPQNSCGTGGSCPIPTPCPSQMVSDSSSLEVKSRTGAGSCISEFPVRCLGTCIEDLLCAGNKARLPMRSIWSSREGSSKERGKVGTEKARGPIWGPGGLPGEGGEQADSRATQEREGVHGGVQAKQTAWARQDGDRHLSMQSLAQWL